MDIRWVPLALVICGCSTTVRGDPSDEMFFIVPGPLSADLMHLQSDGSVISYDRQHMYITKDWVGSWSRVGPERFEIRVPGFVSTIASGSITVYTPRDWSSRIPEVRNALVAFLSKHPERARFEAWELKELGHWEATLGEGDGLTSMTYEPIWIEAETVSRSEIITLLDAMDSWYEDPAKDILPAYLLEYLGVQFLYWPRRGPFLMHDTLEEVMEEIEKAEGEYSPPYVCVSIDAKQFKEEVGTTEPFKFIRSER